MPDDKVVSKSENVEFDDFRNEFLNLRVGESIPKLAIRNIKKITNKNKDDNLAGVDYKYIIETLDNKLLRIGSWILWKKIAAAIKEAGSTKVTLEVKHPGHNDYSVKIISVP